MSRISLASLLSISCCLASIAACSSEGNDNPSDPKDPVETKSEMRQTMEKVQIVYDDVMNNISAFSKSKRDLATGAVNTKKLIELLESDVIKSYSSEQGFQDHYAIILERARAVLEPMEAADAKGARSAGIRLGATCSGCHRDYRDDSRESGLGATPEDDSAEKPK